MRKFHVFVFSFALFCSFSGWPLRSESPSGKTPGYTVTEAQLKTLESIQASQNELIGNLKTSLSEQEETLKTLSEQLRRYQTLTTNLQESLTKSERQVTFRNGVISVTLGISAGCVAGVAVYRLLR